MKSVKQIDLNPIKKAIASLAKGIAKYKQDPSDEFVRDACIQRFEYTYELCGKFLRRYLQMTEQNSETVREMSFPDLIRTACERGLLQNDWSVWKIYRDKRNITNHTYDEKQALAIIESLPSFLEDAQALLKQLEHRIHD